MKKSLALAFFCLLACLPGRAATKVYLKQPINSDTSTSHAYGYANTTASVLAFTTSVTNTTASGTSIQWTKTAGGTQLKWISPPLAAPVTISGTVTMNVWAFEDSALANSTVAFTVKKFAGGVESTSLLTDSAFGSEIGTSVAVKNWTASPTSVTFAVGDRIVLIGDVVNVGTMAGSHTVTVDYGGKTGAADGDSWVQFNETLSFSTEPEFIQYALCYAAATATLNCPLLGASAAGNSLIVFSGILPQSVTASFTDSAGNSYSSLAGPLDWDTGHTIRFWAFHADNIIAGSPITVTEHFSPNADNADFSVSEYAGLSAAPFVTPVTSTGSSSVPTTGSVTPSTTPVMIISGMAHLDTLDSFPANQVPRVILGDVYDYVTTSTGMQSMNESLQASSDWATIIVAATPAATTPVTPVGVTFYGKFTEPGGGDTKFPIVTVCSEMADYAHQPCNLPVTIYTDSTMAMTKSNPFRGDSHGNFDFSAPQGVYVVSAGTPFVPGYSFKVNLNAGGGGSSSASITGCLTSGGVVYQNGSSNTGTCNSNFTIDSSTRYLQLSGSGGGFYLGLGPALAKLNVDDGDVTFHTAFTNPLAPAGAVMLQGIEDTGISYMTGTWDGVNFAEFAAGPSSIQMQGAGIGTAQGNVRVLTDGTVTFHPGTGKKVCIEGTVGAVFACFDPGTTAASLKLDKPFGFTETTAPTGSAGTDFLWGDSTGHRLFQNPNNGGAENIASFPSTAGWTAGNCVKAGTNAGQVVMDTAGCGGGAGGMNTSGSNASGTAVSASWIPGTINSYALGSNALSWTNVFLGTVANQTGSFDTSALTANRSIKIADAASTTLQNCAAAANQFVTSVPQTTGLCAKAQPTLANIAAGASPAGLFNFAASTVRIPEAAGFTSSASSTLGLDTTANAVHTLINSADAIVAGFASAPAGSKCAKTSSTKGLLAESTVDCGTWTDSSTQTGTNKTISQEGSGNVITVVSSPWFRAAGVNATTPGPAFDLPITNAPAPNALTGTNVMKATLDYDDSVNEFAQFDMDLPHTWTGAIDINLKWLVTTGGGSNAVKWTVQTSCSADAATYDTAFNAAQTITTNVAANNIQTVSSQTTVTVTGCAVDNVMNFKIGRDTTDTFTGTARLVGAQVIYRHTGK